MYDWPENGNQSVMIPSPKLARPTRQRTFLIKKTPASIVRKDGMISSKSSEKVHESIQGD